MDESKFKELMDAIQASKQELQVDFLSQISKLQHDVTTSQESSSQEVVKKLNRRAYQFQKKGNEAQFNFNSSVDDHISAAKKELKKLTPTGEQDRAIIQNVTNHLDEGTKLIEVRQKHIRLADRSELGWAVVTAYENDELASDSDDEKRIYRAEREAERMQKRKRSGAANAARKRQATSGGADRVPVQAGPSTTANNQGIRPPAAKPRVIGPCHRCAGWGHLVANCPYPKPKQQYPFEHQPLVSEAEGSVNCVKDMCSGITEQSLPLEAKGASLSVDSVDSKQRASITIEPSEQKILGVKVEEPTCKVAGPSEEIWDLSGNPDSERVTNGELPEQCWEIQQDELQIVDVQGRLKQSFKFWSETLQASSAILEWIQVGYKLPLQYLPEPHSQSNHTSALSHESFVTEAVSQLVANRCVKKVIEKPYICSPLSVVENAEGKLRLVLNLRYLNQCLNQVKFKYEDLRVALLMFTQEDFLFKFDLKSGYHHVDIFEPHQKYLGFAWEISNQINFYVFTVLPFGLATACYAFTKLMRPLVKCWRGRGLRAVVYLDDGIVAVKGKEEAIRESNMVQSDLTKAGFIVNNEKSQWVPTRTVVWLGFQIDLHEGQLTVPEQKVKVLMTLVQQARDNRALRATALASIIGKIMSMGLALGPVTRLMTRSLYGVLNAKSSWCQTLLLTAEATEELSFWLRHIRNFNGQNIWPKASAVRVVYTDASGTGFGGYCVEHGDQVVTGQWSEEEAKQSSTWRELRAVHLVLDSICHRLQNHRVRWFTDNQNVVRIVLYGSRKPTLQEEALAIFATCVNHQIRLEPEWIPRGENEFADYLSKSVDYDDWMLNPEVFQDLDTRWGPHTVDRFADMYNCQLERFNSRYWSPGTEGVDTFTCNWKGENNWWCPPVHLIPRLLRHAEATEAEGTLIMPQRISAPFWPLLFPDGRQAASFVKQIMKLPNQDDLFLPSQSGLNIFKGLPNTPVLALRISFRL